jgi:hypothetical protein
MNGIYELALARNIEIKMAKALAEAGVTLLPQSALGAGMTVTQSNDTEHSYDPVRGVLTVTGVVKIDVHGLSKAS